MPLAFNASATDLAEAVNGMGGWKGVVLAERRELSTWRDNQGDRFEWRLTFSPAEGDVAEMRVRTHRSIATTHDTKRCGARTTNY